VSVFLGHGDGSFAAASDFTTGGSTTGIAWGDCDRNGTPDLVAVEETEHTVSILRNGSYPVPVGVEALVATWTEGNVHLSWRLSEETRRAVAAIDVERAVTSSGPFECRTLQALAPDREMRFADADPLPGTNSWYRLVLRGTGGSVSLAGPVQMRVGIYDIRGREVWSARAAFAAPGEHVVRWDRRTAAGAPAARGIYFVRVQAGAAEAVQKLALLRR
jgi:hypothetical protein